MTPEEVRGRARTLTEAAYANRLSSRASRISRLDLATAHLLTDHNELRSVAADISSATGYAPAMVELCLRRTLTAWRGPALARVIEESEGARGTHTAPDLVVAILAQNTPGLAIPPVLISLALGSGILVKSSRFEPYLAAKLIETIQRLDPKLGKACDAAVWEGGDDAIEDVLAAEADRIIVYGDEAAIATWRARAGERVIAHGPRISLALAGSGLQDQEIRALAEDIAFLDGHGCLSPQALFTVGNLEAKVVGEILGQELAALETRWPRRPLGTNEASAFRRAVDAAEIAVASGRSTALFGDQAARFAIEVTTAARLEPCPLNRFIQIHPIGEEDELTRILRPIRGELECIGIGGKPTQSLLATLQRSHASRLCSFGAMQDPPASWHRADPYLVTVEDERASHSSDLVPRFLQVVAQTSGEPRALEVVSASGSRIHTRDGKNHLDLLSGIGVASIGHAHPRVAKAVSRQARRYTHVMVYGEDALEPQIELAERLAAKLPRHLDTTYFTNSGTEAIEGALKLVRKATGRQRVLSFEGAFHGDTTGSVALGGNPFFREPYRPLIGEIEQIPWDDESGFASIDGTTAAVFAEPVQAEAGVRVPSPTFLPRLAEHCRKVGALLVLDEVVTGFGRTGRFFAFEHWPGAEPDILVLAKSLGGGLPLGAFVASRDLHRALSSDPPLGHVTTFGGNPVCCAAALASLDVLEDEDLITRSARVGKTFLAELRELVGLGGLVSARGIGLLLGLEFESASACDRFAKGCQDHDTLVGWTLHEERVIRLAPPLILSDDDRSEALRTFQEVLR